MLPHGTTRTRVARDHALIASDSHVRSFLPGWTGTMGVILISHQMGARFVQYYANMEKGASSGAPAPGVQRFVYVMEGEAKLDAGKDKAVLKPGGYAYFPADVAHSVRATRPTVLMVFEKPYTPSLDGSVPPIVIGHEKTVSAAPFLGDTDAMLKLLLPELPAFDMAINIFAFKSGTTLPFVETHVMEHGLLMLEGGGVYRLSESWYPVQKGDVIWMAPYCPQWFVAAGKTQASYLYYKDILRDPMTMK